MIGAAPQTAAKISLRRGASSRWQNLWRRFPISQLPQRVADCLGRRSSGDSRSSAMEFGARNRAEKRVRGIFLGLLGDRLRRLFLLRSLLCHTAHRRPGQRKRSAGSVRRLERHLRCDHAVRGGADRANGTRCNEIARRLCHFVYSRRLARPFIFRRIGVHRGDGIKSQRFRWKALVPNISRGLRRGWRDRRRSNLRGNRGRRRNRPGRSRSRCCFLA